MIRGNDAVERHVIARCASGPQCGPHGAGKIVAYQSSPTYTIQRPDGTQFHWAVELCEVVDDGQASPIDRTR